MTNWRKLLWATVPTAEEANEHPVDKLAKDVKAYILRNIDPNYPAEYFKEAFGEKAAEMQSTPVYLNHVLAYLSMGYDKFVGLVATEIYEEYDNEADDINELFDNET